MKIEFLDSNGGDKGIRTPDLLNAIQALSQLSYTPVDNERDYTDLKVRCQAFVLCRRTVVRRSQDGRHAGLSITLRSAIILK